MQPPSTMGEILLCVHSVAACLEYGVGMARQRHYDARRQSSLCLECLRDLKKFGEVIGKAISNLIVQAAAPGRTLRRCSPELMEIPRRVLPLRCLRE